jgi:hypothetical protein
MPGGNTHAPNSARRSRRVSVVRGPVDAGTTHLRTLLSIKLSVSHPLPPGGKVHVVPPVVAKFQPAGSHGTAVMTVTCFHLHWRGPISRPRWPHSDWPSDRRRHRHGAYQKKRGRRLASPRLQVGCADKSRNYILWKTPLRAARLCTWVFRSFPAWC